MLSDDEKDNIPHISLIILFQSLTCTAPHHLDIQIILFELMFRHWIVVYDSFLTFSPLLRLHMN